MTQPAASSGAGRALKEAGGVVALTLVVWMSQLFPSLVIIVVGRVLLDKSWKLLPLGFLAMGSLAWIVACVVFALAWRWTTIRPTWLSRPVVAVVAYAVSGCALSPFIGYGLPTVGEAWEQSVFPVSNLWSAVVVACVLGVIEWRRHRHPARDGEAPHRGDDDAMTAHAETTP